MGMLQSAPLLSHVNASTALWAWKALEERLTFVGWTVGFISLITYFVLCHHLFLTQLMYEICQYTVVAIGCKCGQLIFIHLPGVVNWKAFSSNFRNLYRIPYKLSRCLHCEILYKDCGVGYRGSGKRGVLQGFYSFDDFEGYCGSDCFFEAGGNI